MPLQYSTCALSIKRVLSPIHIKCAEVQYISLESESTLVKASSYGRCKPS